MNKAQNEEKTAKSSLDALKPEILSNARLSELEPKLQKIETRLTSIDNELQRLKKALGTFSTASNQKKETLKDLKDQFGTVNKKADSYKEGRASLIDKKGDTYQKLKTQAEKTYDAKVLQQLWLDGLIKFLVKAEGISVHADVDGRFRFNEVAKKEAILFTLAEYRKVKIFWLQPIRADATMQDLGDYNSILFNNKKFEDLKEVVERVVGDGS